MDHASGKGNVVSQVLHAHEGVLSVLSALVVQGDKMGAESPVELLVLGIQHQEDEVEPGGRRRGLGRKKGGVNKGKWERVSRGRGW